MTHAPTTEQVRSGVAEISDDTQSRAARPCRAPAEETLAIGLYAVQATGSPREALLLSVNQSGDSDSTGMVCGNIAGAAYRMRAIPEEWLGSSELHDVISALARDAMAELSPSAPTDVSWTQRYPAW